MVFQNLIKFFNIRVEVYQNWYNKVSTDKKIYVK